MAPNSNDASREDSSAIAFTQRWSLRIALILFAAAVSLGNVAMKIRIGDSSKPVHVLSNEESKDIGNTHRSTASTITLAATSTKKGRNSTLLSSDWGKGSTEDDRKPGEGAKQNSTTTTSTTITSKDILEQTEPPHPSNLLLSPKPKILPQLMHKWRQRQTLKDPIGDPTPDCDCSMTINCTCVRTIYRTHKMGTVMAQSFFPIRARMGINHAKFFRLAKQPVVKKPVVDIREVLLVRNLIDALASGYLYHKEGRECWKNPWGRPYPNREEFGFGWDPDNIMDPPAGNRSLCRYLADESVVNGMHAYIENSFRVYYRSIFEHLTLLRIRPNLNKRTLIKCYEDFIAHPLETAQEIMDFYHLNMTDTVTNAAKKQIAFNNQSKGTGHATNSSEAARQPIFDAIRYLDANVYNGEIRFANSLLGCGKTFVEK